MMNIRQMMKYLPLNIAPTFDVQYFFVEYLFILENEVRLFQIEFPIISQHMMNNYANYTFCCVHVKINPMVETINKFSTILTNINQNFPFFELNLLQNYFVPNITHR
jgi:hypothetical protein